MRLSWPRPSSLCMLDCWQVPLKNEAELENTSAEAIKFLCMYGLLAGSLEEGS